MKEAIYCQKNSPFQYLGKCRENRMENMNTNVKVYMAKTWQVKCCFWL